MQSLLADGYDCAVIAKDQARLDQASDSFRQMFPGRKILSFALDVTNEVDVNRAIATTFKEFGQIDVVLPF